VTFYGALTIETTSMVHFGLKGVYMGVFLLLANLVVLMLTFWFAWERFNKQRQHRSLTETKACTLCLAYNIPCTHANTYSIFHSLSLYIYTVYTCKYIFYLSLSLSLSVYFIYLVSIHDHIYIYIYIHIGQCL
jgi:hypothetical protein